MTVTVAAVPDTREVARWAESLQHTRRDLVVIDVPPADKPTMGAVAEATLAGLGKDERLTSIRRSPEALATAWLTLGERQAAMVLDAAALPDTLLDQTLEWLEGLGLDAWLLFATSEHNDHVELADRIDALTEAWAADFVAPEAVFDRWTPGPAPAEPAATRLPMLPRVDGIVFREALRRDFDDETFEAIDARCRALVADLRAELASLEGKNKTRKFENLLRRRMDDTGDVEELHLLVRMAQVAGLCEGYQVWVKPFAFYGACHAIPRRGQAETGHWWEALDAYRDPDVGAATALHLAGLDPERLPGLRIADLHDTGDHIEVTSGDEKVVVAGGGVRYLRALLAWRSLDAAGDDEALFTTHRSSRTRQRYANSLLTTTLEVGVRATTQRVSYKHPSTHRWLGRHGITISKLTYTPTGP